MNILLVTNMYPSQGGDSWRGSFVKEQVENINALDKNILIDVFHIRAKFSRGSNLNYILAFFQLLWKVSHKRVDVIHCHHAFCVLICCLFIKKIIYTVHEGELNNSFTSFLIKLAIIRSNIVIYVNKTEYQNSKKKNKFFIPCGIDLNIYKPLKFRKQSRDFIFFPADPSRPEKNAYLLKAIERDINEEFSDLHIMYGGDIPRRDMPELMAQALIVVSIGKFESDGLVLKEAMAVNTPVISTRVGNSTVYLDSSSGVFIEESKEQLMSAIKTILSRYKYFLAGRERLIKLGVDATQTADAIIDVYNSSKEVK